MTAARAPRFTPDEAFLQLKDLIRERTGHFYYEVKDALLWERLGRRFRATGAATSAAYLALLSDPEAGEAEWVALAAEITIGETFFFRYAEQFAALERTILPEIIAANRETRRIRVWSAGCSNGAEPYSVAILLRRLLGEEIAEWRITILGTDLNEAALDAARMAQFGSWSLRTLAPAERERDFLPAPGGRLWTLKPQHRGLVRFQRHNLMELLDDAAPLQMSEFDLILCRNVLIYFHPEVLPRMVRALGERLADGGWLLVGHAETGVAPLSGLLPVELPGALAYRRMAAEAVPPATPLPPSPPPIPPPVLPPVAAPPPRPAPPPKAPPPPEETGAPREDLLSEVRHLADLGEMQAARRLCRAGLRAEPLQPALHYYDGLVAAALGERDMAERSFRHALYLRGDFVMAHHQLGLLLADAGRGAEARRAIGNALRLALGLPDDAVLAEGDGLTASAFREIARLRLAALPPGA